MSGPSWLVDGNRFATKIKCASGTSDSEKVKWKSNPCRSCPSCHYVIDNSDVIQEWPGLPRGVKFDPTDNEIIQHLHAKSGTGDDKPHPFISEFIPTVDKEDGICYTHPCKLPGVKNDGGAFHFFHRSIKAYNTGTRKRRKIHGDEMGDVRWHKTGRTKPVFVNGVQKGCKKIMVLYVSTEKGGKAEKTNWVMHQYHLGTQEDEKDGEFVISKVFQQQPPQVKQNEKTGRDDVTDDDVVVRVDPVTPKLITPEPPRNEMQVDPFEDDLIPLDFASQDDGSGYIAELPKTSNDDDTKVCQTPADETLDHNNNENGDSETMYLVDSQQLIAGLQLCADLFQSQSPTREEDGNVDDDDIVKKKSFLSEYAHLGSEVLKKDLEECQNLSADQDTDPPKLVDPPNTDQDTQPEVRLSQLEFFSQDSYNAWGGTKIGD